MLVIPGYQVGNRCSGRLCIRFYARPVTDTVMFIRAPAETKDVVDRRSPWSGECGDTEEEMMELMRTGGDMTEKLARNQRCGSGCGRPGAVERRRVDTQQSRYGVWDQNGQAISEREQRRIGSAVCEERRME